MQVCNSDNDGISFIGARPLGGHLFWGEWAVKRFFGLLLFVLFLLINCACQAVDKDNQFEMPSEDLATLGQTQPTVTGGEETEPAGDGQLSVPYQYGNAQMGIPSFLSYGSDRLIFWYYDAMPSSGSHHFYLCTLDKDTWEVRLLCQDPACDHSDGSCISCDKYLCEQYDGEIYTIDRIEGGAVKKLRGDYFQDITRGLGVTFCHANGNLYVRTPEGTLVCYEKGKNAPKIVAEEFPGYWMVVSGNYLYGSTEAQGVVRVDLTREAPEVEYLLPNAVHKVDVDSGNFYYVSMTDFCLYQCDENFQNPVKLTEEKIDHSALNFDGEYLYFCRMEYGKPYSEVRKTLYRISEEEPGEPEAFVELPEGVIGTIYTVPNFPYVFVQGVIPTKDETPGQEVYYAVGKDTGEVIRLEIPEI